MRDSRRFVRGSELAAILGALAVLSLAAVSWVSPGKPDGLLTRRREQLTQELFSWKDFEARQSNLESQADGIAQNLGAAGNGISPVQQKGSAIKEALAKLMQGLRPRRARPPTAQTHRYIPMDQELAILKVQKQMRTEQKNKFRWDRIEGGGDVAAIVNEQGQADERSALGEPQETGPDTKTHNLFENCEDGSLTAEDAELCGRRASAIKMITRNAIQQQLAKNPPVSPDDVEGIIDTEKENKARSALVAYALIGKQYVALLDEEKKAAAETAAQRKALLAQGRKVNPQKKQQLRAARRRSPRAPGNRHVENKVSQQRSKGSGVSALSAGSAAREMTPRPAKSSEGKPSKRNSAKRTHTLQLTRGRGSKKALLLGDLGPLQDIADAMPKHLTTPKTDSKTRLADLEGAISDTQARLAKEKMLFTKQMLKRQKELQAEFLESMQQIHAGLSVVDDVGTAPGAAADADAQPSSKSMLAAEQAAFMQRQRDSVIAAAASAAGPTPAVAQQMNPVVTEVEREIAASHLFKHPPQPDTASSHKSAESLEKDTVRAALEAQFDQVASDGHVAPKVRHDKWSDLIAQMSRPIEAAVAESTNKPAASASSKQVKRGEVDEGGKARSQAEQAASGRQAGDTPAPNKRQEALRLLSSYGFKRGLHSGHIGPASYDALANAAMADMQSAIGSGAPTMAIATKEALSADSLAHNPQAELLDAERVLCTVAMLKQGMCSSKPHNLAEIQVRGQGVVGRARSPRGSVERSRHVRHPTLSHVAKDVESTVLSTLVGQ